MQCAQSVVLGNVSRDTRQDFETSKCKVPNIDGIQTRDKSTLAAAIKLILIYDIRSSVFK